MSKEVRDGPTALILSQTPERQKIRELQETLFKERDAIAGLDLEIETLRDDLENFETHYHARLAAEHAEYQRLQNVLRQMDRWKGVLKRQRETPSPAPHPSRKKRATLQPKSVWPRPDDKKEKDTDASKEVDEKESDYSRPRSDAPSRADRLKQAFRALARRYHPDLAENESDQISFSSRMTQINELYRQGHLDTLEAMVEQAKGGEIDDFDIPDEEQIQILKQRLAWFKEVKEQLRDERHGLEATSSCALMRDVQQASTQGTDLIEELRQNIHDEVKDAYLKVEDAARNLEGNIAEHNRHSVESIHLNKGSHQEKSKSVTSAFASNDFIRLGQKEIERMQVSEAAKEMSDWVIEISQKDSGLLTLLFLTWITDLSPSPLPGLKSFETIEQRFDFLLQEEEQPPTLQEVLVAADDLIEFGVHQSSARIARAGLRFRSPQTREALTYALRTESVREILENVLGVLGEDTTCKNCEESVYLVPLYHCRGLDTIFADLCPACGAAQNRYWMPRSQDHHDLINTTYMDFELVSEFIFYLADAPIIIQLLPIEVETLKVGDLKKRIFADFFKRYELELKSTQVRLWQDSLCIREGTPLVALNKSSFDLRFGPSSKLRENEALEILRYRIRTRFSQT